MLTSSSSVSYLDCIPKSFAKHIAKDNFLTRLRINRVFRDFLRSFQQRTMERGRPGAHEVMCKYIATLEHLAPRFATETFSVSHMVTRQALDLGSSYLLSAPADGSSTGIETLLAHQVMVSGTQGIQWRKTSGQKVNDENNKIVKVNIGKYIMLFLRAVSFFTCGLNQNSLSPAPPIDSRKQLLQKGLPEEGQAAEQPARQPVAHVLRLPRNFSHCYQWRGRVH